MNGITFGHNSFLRFKQLVRQFAPLILKNFLKSQLFPKFLELHVDFSFRTFPNIFPYSKIARLPFLLLYRLFLVHLVSQLVHFSFSMLSCPVLHETNYFLLVTCYHQAVFSMLFPRWTLFVLVAIVLNCLFICILSTMCPTQFHFNSTMNFLFS